MFILEAPVQLIQGCQFGSCPSRRDETPEWILKPPYRGGDNVLDPWVTLREQGCVVGSNFCSLPLASGLMSTSKVCVGSSLLKIKKDLV